MTELTAETRNALPDSAFALPGRRYPIANESHARNALARVSANGTPAEQAAVRAAVHKRYPGIAEEGRKKDSDGKLDNAIDGAMKGWSKDTW